MMIKKVISFFIFLVICFSAAMIGQAVTRPSIGTWYAALEKPFLCPPNWVFAPAWSTLYCLMAWSAWLIWQKKDSANIRSAMSWFAIQLALNSLWSVLFFGLQRPEIAFFEIVALWGAIALTAREFFGVSKLAAYLLFPYLAWVAFAAYLNYSIWVLN